MHTLSVYDINSVEAGSSNMKHAFVVAQRNIFQQVTSVLTLQAHTSLGKVSVDSIHVYPVINYHEISSHNQSMNKN